MVISNISMVADQVQALNCAVLDSNPRVGPVHYQEVRSGLHFDPFCHFFPFDSLGGVPENPGTILRSVRISVGTIGHGTIVAMTNQKGVTTYGSVPQSEDGRCNV